MRKLFYVILVLALAWMFSGCGDTVTNTDTVVVDKEDLNPPLGLVSVTGDGEVALMWYGSNWEDDFRDGNAIESDAGYRILMSTVAPVKGDIDTSLSTNFTVYNATPITASTGEGVYYHTIEGLNNGTDYWFAVRTIVKADPSDVTEGKVSYPSNIVKDIPRPENPSITLANGGATNGYNFGATVAMQAPGSGANYQDASGCDLIIEGVSNLSGRLYFSVTNVPDDGETNQPYGIQDLGYMGGLSALPGSVHWDLADVAPSTGYNGRGHSLQAIPTHVYAICFANSATSTDNYYAKIYVSNVTITADGPPASGTVAFISAHQTVEGEEEYK